MRNTVQLGVFFLPVHDRVVALPHRICLSLCLTSDPCALEPRRQTRGGTDPGCRWIESQYGVAELKKFGHMDVHCSGTTMGTHRGFVVGLRA